ncbi:hypothetical protein EEDFHM_03852 [Methylorubrum populi]
MAAAGEPCPRCGGQGRTLALVNRGGGRGGSEIRDCATCAGVGVISAVEVARLRAGAALREGRVAAGLTLSEATARTGLGPADYSAVERGRPAPDGRGPGDLAPLLAGVPGERDLPGLPPVGRGWGALARAIGSMHQEEDPTHG